MRDDAVLRRAFPLGRGLGRIDTIDSWSHVSHDKHDIPNRRSSFIVNNIICRLHLDCLIKVTVL